MRRAEILRLLAMNQLDLIKPLMTNEADRAFLKENLPDRFNFEAADMDSPSRCAVTGDEPFGPRLFEE